MRTFVFVLLAAIFGASWMFAAKVTVEDAITGTYFRRYSTTTTDKKKVAFYLSTGRAPTAKRPLVVWVQGTGCESLFQKGVAGQYVAGPQNLVEAVAGSNVVVLAVEKPGVEFLDEQQDQGNSRDCRQEFRERYTLENWAASIAAAIRAARELPEIDASRALIIGHSEGAVVAMRVSNIVPVTHVASLAGGGPNHLFVVAEFMRRNGFDPENAVYPCWRDMQRDPDSIIRYCWGQTFRQWSSFWSTSLIQEALRSKAKLYFMHGSLDGRSSIAAFDVMQSELMAARRAAVFERVEGASHTMDRPGEHLPQGLLSAFDRVIRWFLAE